MVNFVTKENKKDFNAMMKNSKDMPKIQIVKDEKTIKNMVELKCFLHRQFIMIDS